MNHSSSKPRRKQEALSWLTLSRRGFSVHTMRLTRQAVALPEPAAHCVARIVSRIYPMGPGSILNTLTSDCRRTSWLHSRLVLCGSCEGRVTPCVHVALSVGSAVVTALLFCNQRGHPRVMLFGMGGVGVAMHALVCMFACFPAHNAHASPVGYCKHVI